MGWSGSNIYHAEIVQMVYKIVGVLYLQQNSTGCAYNERLYFFFKKKNTILPPQQRGRAIHTLTNSMKIMEFFGNPVNNNLYQIRR